MPLLLRLLASLALHLPRPLAGALGAALATLAALFLPRQRAAIRSNLSQILSSSPPSPPPPSESGRAVTGPPSPFRTFALYGRYLADLPRCTSANLPALRRFVDLSPDTPAALASLSAEPAGALLLTAHYGNWELAATLVASYLGRPVTAIARPVASPALERVLNELRNRRGLTLLPPSRAPRAILRALQNGQYVALLADRSFSVPPPPPTPFFGRPAPLPRGPAWFAWQTRVPVYVGTARYLPSRRVLFHLSPPLHPSAHPSEPSLRLAIASALESAISLSPSQWFVFAPFWPSPQTAPPAP